MFHSLYMYMVDTIFSHMKQEYVVDSRMFSLIISGVMGLNDFIPDINYAWMKQETFNDTPVWSNTGIILIMK